ncbi:MAG TPA: hypothetical protein VG253_03080 [Streptosporangiaceae bacterium]|nr:hypothetical protein [Streptosporangiaceae bacterium]
MVKPKAASRPKAGRPAARNQRTGASRRPSIGMRSPSATPRHGEYGMLAGLIR